MDPLYYLPLSLAIIILPATIGLWLFADLMIAREIQELNKLNGWEN